MTVPEILVRSGASGREILKIPRQTTERPGQPARLDLQRSGSDDVTSTALWSELRELSYLQASRAPVWRISTAPTHGPRIVKALSTYMPCAVAYDWSGGLVWLEVPQTSDAGSSDIRRVIASHGGHATLIRAEPSVRAAADVFQPLSPGLQRVSRGLKAAFDPAGILNPGRLYADA